MTRTLTVNVLGGVGASRGEVAAAFPGLKERAVLALLALEAGRTVSVEQLIDGVWGEAVTDSVLSSLRVRVSRLRRSLDVLGAGPLVVSVPGGYRLDVPPDVVDAHRFTAAIRQARDAARGGDSPRALTVWREAMAAWGGEPLIGLGAVPFAPTRATGLLNQWLDAHELGVELELAAGDPLRVLDDAEQLAAAHPYRESAWGCLARLLYGVGRPADALARLAELRRTLRDDLGLDPSPELRALELAILDHAPELTVIVAPPGQHARVTSPAPRPGTAAKVPRDDWVARLAVAVTGGPVVLHGEAGIGKSTLTADLVAVRAAADLPTLRVGVRSEPQRALEVIAAIVDQLDSLAGAADWRAAMTERQAAVVAHLAGAAAPGELVPTSGDELFSAACELIAGGLRGTAVLLVVEDVHWLDASSSDVLDRLLLEPGVAMMLTSRRHPGEWGRGWSRARAIELTPFEAADVRAWLAMVAPDRVDDDRVAAMLRRSGGNPLLLSFAFTADGDDHAATTPAVADLVRERAGELSRRTRDAMALAALLGDEFPLDPLVRLRPTIEADLAAAADEGLVRLDAERRVGVFLHGLVAEALAEALPAGLRVAWHDELCRVLVAGGAAPGAIARHALGAAEIDPLRAARAALDAGRNQAEYFEWSMALDWARRGLAVVERSGLDGDRVVAGLRLLAGTCQRRAGGTPASAYADLLAAAEALSAAGDDELFVVTTTELCLHGHASNAGGVDARAAALYEQALLAAVDDVVRAPLLSAGAALMALSADAPRGRRLYAEAVATAGRSGDRGAQRAVLLNAHLGYEHPGDQRPRRRAAEWLAGDSDVEARWEGQFLGFGLALIDADRTAIDRSLAALRALTPVVRQRTRTGALLQIECVHAMLCGDIERADALAAEALEAVLAKYSESWATSVYAALLFPIREIQGRVAELAGPVAVLAAAAPGFVTWQAVAAYVGYAAGDDAMVAAALDALAGDQLALAEDLTWTGIATLLCRVAWYTQHRRLAEQLRTALVPFAEQMTWNGISTHGPVAAGLAFVADLLGDRRAVDLHLATAAALLDRLRAPHLWWRELDGLR